MISLLLGLGGGLIGFLLSVLGAGGSILLLPLLVSGAALPTREAVPLSLIVVMLLALANLGPYLRRGQFAPRPALLLGLPALGGSWIGGSWVKAGLIPEAVQLSVFAAAALLASWLLLRRQANGTEGPCRAADVLLVLQGLLVGLLTGIAGVGGPARTWSPVGLTPQQEPRGQECRGRKDAELNGLRNQPGFDPAAADPAAAEGR